MTDPKTHKPPASPCVSVCALDDNDLCIGCHRTGTEIARWTMMGVDEKRAVLAACESRARASGAHLYELTGGGE
ncbi:MAG: DUF1289 domain-containing protein [Pseudomonadota bacterium]|nr:DUF1289 domain-containing protein [Pseudomonadota bacterium]